MYKYITYGLYIESDIKLPLLETYNYNDSADVFIARDLNLKHSNNKFNNLNINEGSFCRDGIGYFYVHNGEKIFYDYEGDLNINDFCRTLLNQAMAYIFFQKKKFVMHASAVSYKDNAYLFSGISGYGKSTLALSLMKDFKLISEDTCVIDFINRPSVVPSFPFIKIGSNNLEYDFINSEPIEFKKDVLKRYGYKILPNKLAKGNKKISKCFFLNWGEEFKVEEMNLSEKISHIIGNSFRSLPYNSDLKTNKVQFQNITNFLKDVEFYMLTRKKMMTI